MDSLLSPFIQYYAHTQTALIAQGGINEFLFIFVPPIETPLFYSHTVYSNNYQKRISIL